MGVGESRCGVEDTFRDEAGGQEHLDGEIAAELFDRADELFVEEPQVDEIDVLAAKHSWAARPGGRHRIDPVGGLFSRAPDGCVWSQT
jgi:hypothetical protein